jgi:hypothetical protein
MFAAAILTAIMALTVKHLPVWAKRVVSKTPAWLQAAILHFGYAGWIGGVAGHMMGAPLAIMWYAVYTLWLKKAIDTDVENAGETQVIRDTVTSIKGWFKQAGTFAHEVEAAVTAA